MQAPPKKTKKKAPTPPSLEVDDCLLDEDRFDEPVSLRAAIVIELGDYKGMGYLRAKVNRHSAESHGCARRGARSSRPSTPPSTPRSRSTGSRGSARASATAT